MKKILLTLLMLFTCLTHFASGPKDPWNLFATGRYHDRRVLAFDKGLDGLRKGNYSLAERQMRSSLRCTHPYNYPAYMNFGVSTAQQGKHRQAEGLFLKAFNAGASQDAAYYNVFVCRMNQEKYPAAVEYFVLLPEFIKNAHPEETANFLANSGQLDAAYPYYLEVLNDSNTSLAHATYFNASLSAWAVHDTALAVISINSAIAARPQVAKYHFQKAKMYLVLDPEVSIREFRKTVHLEPTNLDARLGWVRALVCKGDGRLALEVIKHTLKEKDMKVGPDWFQLMAIAYAQTGEMDKALECMNQVNTLRTPTAFDHKVMGDLYLNSDSLEAAKYHYQQALSDSFIADARMGQAIVAFLDDQISEAQIILQSLHTEHPEYNFSSYGFYLEAMIHYVNGNYTGFEMSITQAGYTKNRESSKLLIQAMRAMSQFEFHQADRILKKALRIEPDNINLQLTMGSLQYQLGDHQAALQTFTRALQLDPDNIEIKNMMALCQSGLGMTGQAIIQMMEVLAAKPTARYYNNMAMIYAMVKVPAPDQQAAYCGYFETAQVYMDSAFAAGLDTVFKLNVANLHFSLQDTGRALQMMHEMQHYFALNNAAAVNFLEKDQQAAKANINAAIEACPYNTPEVFHYNENIIRHMEYKEEIRFVYLYQYLPAVLPSRHQLSYSFTMPSELPEHVDGAYIIIKDLHGAPQDPGNALAAR
jgi:tetratricopeptide (TPR) repeat protein